MIAEGVLQFLAAGNRDCSLFGVIFRSKRALSSLRIYRRDRLAYLLDFCPWTGCRGHSGKFCRYCIYYACFQNREYGEKMSGYFISYSRNFSRGAGNRHLQNNLLQPSGK